MGSCCDKDKTPNKSPNENTPNLGETQESEKNENDQQNKKEEKTSGKLGNNVKENQNTILDPKQIQSRSNNKKRKQKRKADSKKDKSFTSSKSSTSEKKLEHKPKTDSKQKENLPRIASQTSKKQQEHERKADSNPMTVNNVLFTCPAFFGPDLMLTKGEMLAKLEEKLKEEKTVESAVAMINSLNYDRIAMEECVEALVKVVDAIIEQPREIKHRQIDVKDPSFQAFVAIVKGSNEFLEAIGFEEEENGILTMETPNKDEIKQLTESRKKLKMDKPIAIKLCRNPKIFDRDPRRLTSDMNLPESFFELTSKEVWSLHKTKEELEEMKMLKSRGKPKSKIRYKYCVVRIKFPDSKILQGAFNTDETGEDLFNFVRIHLHDSIKHIPFVLINRETLGKRLKDKQSQRLNELAPSSLLIFQSDEKLVDAIFLKMEETPQ